MAKLSLKADPTFTSSVEIPVAGGQSVGVNITFKHRTKTELEAFIKSRAGVPDIDTFMDMVTGWDLTDAFNRENVQVLLEHHIGAGLATYAVYVDELVKGKLKN